MIRRILSAQVGWLTLLTPALGIGLYVVALSSMAIRERHAMYQFDEDLAIYDQIVWNSAHGRWFASTLIQHANTMLGDHFSPIVAIFVPVYWFVANPDILLVGQTLALALAAFPLYAFARRRIGVLGASLLVVAYLVYPALHYVNLFQFHEIALLPLPLALALFALETERRWLFYIAAIASLCVKEDVAIVMLGVGILWWLRQRDWQAAVVTIAMAIGVGFLTIGILLPHFNTAGGGYYYVRRYAYLGDTPLGIAVGALTQPGLILDRLTSPDRLIFLAELFGPLALTPLFGWEYTIAALPTFAYLMLGDSPDQYAINRHYLSPLLPFLFFGSSVGAERLGLLARKIDHSLTLFSGARGKGNFIPQGVEQSNTPPLPLRESGARGEGSPTATLAAGLIALASLAGTYWFGPTPLGRAYDPALYTPSHHTHQLAELLAAVPGGASVSTSRNLLSWFSERQAVYRYPQIQQADYVLLDWRQLRFPIVYQADDGAFPRLLQSSEYQIVASGSGAVLFARQGLLPSPAFTQEPTLFANQIVLKGYQIHRYPTDHVLDVTLFWQATVRPPISYTVFVHAIDEQGESIGQNDSMPLDNLFPTNDWRAGQLVPDTHSLTLPDSLASARLHFQVGLYDLKTGVRLPITSRGLPGGSDFVEFTSP